jgi:glycosyltransferase involved in cell wall biosynthesis
MGAMSLGLLTSVGQIGLPLVLVICDDWLIYAPLIDAWTRGFRRWPIGPSLGQKLFGVPTHFRPEQSITTGCFISETVRARAIGNARWAPARTMIAYNGIDTRDFPLRIPEQRDWRWSLLYVGRVEERKGVGVAVEALANLPQQATLTIDGPVDDSFIPRLRARIEELGVRDRVTFQLSARAELHRLYAAADAVLFPVLWEEPFGLVPLEAMACATPVIATGTGGSREFLFDEVNCLIAKPGDAGALAAAAHRLADDPDLRKRIVLAGQTTAAALGVDEYARVLEAWHRAAADRYREGEPPDRPPMSELLAPLGKSKD